MQQQNHNPATLNKSLILLMAVSTGVAVANIYYAQPLLHSMAHYFSISYAASGIIVTVAQLSYALGLILLVPLGDLLNQKKLIVSMTALSTIGLIICALSQHLATLLLGTAISAFFAVVAQVIVPLSATLAAPDQRGKAVGTIMAGLLLGILLARTVAGTLSSMGSWHTVYWCAAMLMIVITISLHCKLPDHQQHAGLSYPRLLASILGLFKQEPVFLWRSILGSFVFASFTLMWTPLAFLLAEPPYGYNDATIGLFGIAGAVGAVAAMQSGKLVDQGKGNLTTRYGLLLLALSWIALYVGTSSVLALLAGIILLDMCVQLVHVTNQNIIYQLRPEARNRLNAGYMLMYFIGGATGSLLAANIYQHFKWPGVCIAGFIMAGLALLVWLRTLFLTKHTAADTTSTS